MLHFGEEIYCSLTVMPLDGLREGLRREDCDATSVGEKVPLQSGIDYDLQLEGSVPVQVLLDDHLAAVQRLGTDIRCLLGAGPEHNLLRLHSPVLGHPDHIAEPFLGIEVTHGNVSASLRGLLNGDDAVEGEVDHLALPRPPPEDEPPVAELLEDISGKDEGAGLRIAEAPVAEQYGTLTGDGVVQGHQVVQSNKGVVLLEPYHRALLVTGCADVVLEPSDDVLYAGKGGETAQLLEDCHGFGQELGVLAAQGHVGDAVVRVLVGVVPVLPDDDGGVVPQLVGAHHLDVRLHGSP